MADSFSFFHNNEKGTSKTWKGRVLNTMDRTKHSQVFELCEDMLK